MRRPYYLNLAGIIAFVMVCVLSAPTFLPASDSRQQRFFLNLHFNY